MPPSLPSQSERFDRLLQRLVVAAVLATALALIGTGVALIAQEPVAARGQLSAGR